MYQSVTSFIIESLQKKPELLELYTNNRVLEWIGDGDDESFLIGARNVFAAMNDVGAGYVALRSAYEAIHDNPSKLAAKFDALLEQAAAESKELDTVLPPPVPENPAEVLQRFNEILEGFTNGGDRMKLLKDLQALGQEVGGAKGLEQLLIENVDSIDPSRLQQLTQTMYMLQIGEVAKGGHQARR